MSITKAALYVFVFLSKSASSSASDFQWLGHNTSMLIKLNLGPTAGLYCLVFQVRFSSWKHNKLIPKWCKMPVNWKPVLEQAYGFTNILYVHIRIETI